ncbi:Uncharacterised protein [Clostridioides difficile]|nr:Uncharacterised protein [Clostridioides difficile]
MGDTFFGLTGFILTKWYVKQYILAGADLGALQVLY